MKNFKEEVEQFWTDFTQKQKQLEALLNQKAEQQTIEDCFAELLYPLFPDVPFDIGHNQDTTLPQQFQLILSPSSNELEMRILRYWKQQRPQQITNTWIFKIGTPASQHPIQIADKQVDTSQFTIYYNIHADAQLIDIEVYEPSLSLLNKSTRLNLLYTYLDHYISEIYSMKYIGAMKFVDEIQDTPSVNIVKLKELIDNTIKQNKWTDYSQEDLTVFTNYSLKPLTYQKGWNLREDIHTGSSSCMPIINAYHNQDRALVEHYQTRGIHFGYLFYTNTQVPKKKIVEVREHIENALIDIFQSDHIAEILGGATGKEFSYIDLVIYDLDSFMAYTAGLMSGYNFDIKGYAPFILEGDTVAFE